MDRTLKIITPKRKNQKNKIITHKEKILLKDRHNIENEFAFMNNNHRVIVCRDKNMNNYFFCLYVYVGNTY